VNRKMPICMVPCGPGCVARPGSGASQIYSDTVRWRPPVATRVQARRIIPVQQKNETAPGWSGTARARLRGPDKASGSAAWPRPRFWPSAGRGHGAEVYRVQRAEWGRSGSRADFRCHRWRGAANRHGPCVQRHESAHHARRDARTVDCGRHARPAGSRAELRIA